MKKPLYNFCLTLLASGITSSAVSAAKTPSKSTTWRGQSVTEFDASENSTFSWQIVNDGVMGGLSKGNIKFTDEGTMRFSGNLSLENNGGFSTVRSQDVNLDLSNDLGLLLRVKGDGRTYQARLASDARYRGMEVSFMGEFKTTRGVWQEVKIPFADFKGSWRGTDLDDKALNPAEIQRVGILLGDKKQGPFDVEIDYIRTYGKGQGKAVTAKASIVEKKATTVSNPEAKSYPGGIIETAVSDGRFTTLKAALDAAKLTTFFQWDNKLTVFAPTDEAFAKLPKEVVADLLKPENKEKLVSILSYHVVAGENGLADALKASKVKTVQGKPVEIAFSNGKVRVNDAAIIDADVTCSDGVIHVIDTVLLPPEPQRQTVLSTAAKAGGFSTLLAAIEAADLGSVLEGEGPFTVFAPTEDAFAALPNGTVDSLLKKENKEKLVSVLTYHVVPGRVSAGDALNAGTATTVQGAELKFAFRDGRLLVNDAPVRSIDIDGGNGVIHVIDSVLLPPVTNGKNDQASASACGTSCESACAASECDDESIEAAYLSIVNAIEKGVPLYNGGNSKGCADVYQACLTELASNDQIDDRARRMLDRVLEGGRNHDSNDSRAWLYRRALDGMIAYMAQELK